MTPICRGNIKVKISKFYYTFTSQPYCNLNVYRFIILATYYSDEILLAFRVSTSMSSGMILETSIDSIGDMHVWQINCLFNFVRLIQINITMRLLGSDYDFQTSRQDDKADLVALMNFEMLYRIVHQQQQAFKHISKTAQQLASQCECLFLDHA